VRDWTVEELAREVAVSRSVLAQRFTDLVGEAPMRYLAAWRMQLAKQMMRDGSRNIQDVATRVGYESEAAFNRAFKRATGSPRTPRRTGERLLTPDHADPAVALEHGQRRVGNRRHVSIQSQILQDI